MNKKIYNQSGQIIVVLLLVMLVALSVGLALTQRSITDITTSTQTEQSTRSFSAAEAGIEKALVSAPNPNLPVNLENNSSASVNSSALLPQEDVASGVGIEYPPIGKETTAQFWFTSPTDYNTFYNSPGPDVTVYFGNPDTTDKPALELKFITFKNNVFASKTFYLDSDRSRTADAGAYTNRFSNVSAYCGSPGVAMPQGILGNNHLFYCGVGLNSITDSDSSLIPCNTANNCRIILARARFLYIEDNQKLALAPASAGNPIFPPQVQLYNSVGVSGQSQKQLQAFRVKDVVPPWFDFAIFSVNAIQK